MARTPRTRHSRTKREPLTIDLEADAVRRESDEQPSGSAEVESAAAETDTQQEAPVGSDPDISASSDGNENPENAERTAADEQEDAKAEVSQATEGADGDAPQPEEEQPSAPAQQKGGGFGRALAAGLIGGAVALALGYGLQRSELLPLPGGNGSDPAVENLRQELAAVQSQLSQTRQAGTGGDSTEQLSQLQNQLAQLQETVSQLQSAPADGGAQNAGLVQRVTQVESTVESAAQAAKAAQETVTGHTQQLQDISNQVTQLAEQVKSQDEGPKLALIVAASALKSAVERGQPFASELQTYAALAPDASTVDPLKAYADTGVPTRAELASEAPQVASSIAATTSQVPQDAGLMDRLMASARSAVKVRPVGEVEGDTPEAIAARMEAAVQQGDYAKALTEYEALPPQAKAVAKPFADKLSARQTADRILEEALSGALKPA